MKTPIAVGLIALLCLPVAAGAKEKPKTADAPATTPAATVTDALNQVTGKNQIVGVTETSGTRFLGRVVSADHGLYVVQTFHFAGPPNVTTQQTTRTVGSGKKKRVVHGTEKSYAETSLPDDQAVRLLLSGVAGATTTPLEVAGERVMLSPPDVKFLQTLTPPDSPKVPKGPAGQAVVVSPSAAKQLVWTVATLWPPAKP